MPAAIITTDPIDKLGLIDLLLGIRHAVLYAFVLQTASEERDIAADIDGKKYGFEDVPGAFEAADLSPLASHLRHPDTSKVVKNNLALILRQSLVRLGYEVVMMYVEKTNQFAAYKAAPFYQYLRIVRNLVSHKDGAVLLKWPPDLEKNGTTSVSWRGRTITKSQVGTEIVMTPAESVQLFSDLQEFVAMDLC